MDIERYLERIGAYRPARPDLDALRELHARHLDAVPFENLSIHLGEPVDLAEDALLDKIVRRRRGGFCYELNGAFALLLRALGFEVRLLSARVYDSEGVAGAPFDHLALRVELDQPWLADVGFGRHARYPLRMHATEPQADPEGEYTVLDAPEGDLDIRRDGTPVYRVQARARALADFERTCWWQVTSPESHFTRGLTCSLPTPDGRVTLSGNTLIETVRGERVERTLADDSEILATYKDRFGIVLDQLPLLP